MGVSTPKNGGQYMGGVFMGYTWGIHGIYVCIAYVSGMYRVCIGNVSEDSMSEKGAL